MKWNVNMQISSVVLYKFSILFTMNGQNRRMEIIVKEMFMENCQKKNEIIHNCYPVEKDVTAFDKEICGVFYFAKEEICFDKHSLFEMLFNCYYDDRNVQSIMKEKYFKKPDVESNLLDLSTIMC